MRKLLETMKKNYIYGIMLLSVIIITILGVILIKKNAEYTVEVENRYNLAFYELIDYIQNVETYLAKSLISNSPEHGAETLTNVWRESNLAIVYLSQLPISTNELFATSKFLNQVSDYSYALSRKNIAGESLTEEELDNLRLLHEYSVELRSILNQLALDMQEGRVSWQELTRDIEIPFAQQVSNLSADSFGNIDQTFGEYRGLIYDGAFSEHIESVEKKGLTGEEINKDVAEKIITEFVGKTRIDKITSNGLIENGNIVSYDFSIQIKDGNKQNPMSISISKKGGHIVLMNYNREIAAEVLSYEDADKIGKEFLENKKINGMKSTYYIKQGGSITINYAYEQEGVLIYPDLIKLKIALDNGEILGIETNGYLNNHHERVVGIPEITIEKAQESLNKNLEITSARVTIIPTKWKTEVFCYEFKGKVDNMDFLVYINAKTGKEENILLILDTPNGVLTQ